MNIITRMNHYFKEHEIHIPYSRIRIIRIDYLIEIDKRLEKWVCMNKCIRKGGGKHEITKLCDELMKRVIKLWEYAIHGDILGERNNYSKSDSDATFV